MKNRYGKRVKVTDYQLRIHRLNSQQVCPGPVVYWMSREQRVADNWGLYHAQQLAIGRKVPLLVVFTLADRFLGATMRHFGFMLRGLEQVSERLAELQIPFVLLQGEPQQSMLRFMEQQQPGCVVCDFDPLRIKRQWFDGVAASARVAVLEVDGHNIVPCRIASPKREFGAYTLRPKLKRLLPDFLTAIPQMIPHPYPPPPLTGGGRGAGEAFLDGSGLLSQLQLDSRVGEVSDILPGEQAAANALADFIGNRLHGYATRRNDPLTDGQSGLSPWLHFGQLSPQRVALAVAAQDDSDDVSAMLEELIVRRELSDNFCLHCLQYDAIDAAPDWARKTLETHRHDPRQYCYNQAEFEQSDTHDQLWNAAQREMVLTGKMHGYLRMYWAKKILEWTESPEEAISTAVYLNDRYALDGRDPNGYAGIAWSICGVHDRAWGERPVFGKIRFMSYDGCKRKFDLAAYCKLW
jgi:deoxyribodipyrimidine photo-lyase